MNPSSSALLDPLVVDVRPLSRLFETPALVVAHAAQRGLDVLTHAVGVIQRVRHAGRRRVRRLRDAVALGAPAGRAGRHAGQGRSADGLAAPAADWPRQKAYAESDVVWLLQLQDRLTAELE